MPNDRRFGRMEPRAAAATFTVSLVDHDLVLVWDTQEPEDQADVLARLMAWLRNKTTQVDAL